MTSVIIIGAGIGGIATAARLAKAGYSVSVYEKQATPGGRVEVVSGKGYRFDAGPTLFLMPDVWRSTYADLGEDLDQHLDLIRLDPTYRVHFHDGSSIDLSSNLVLMREQLDRLSPGSFEAYLRYLGEGYRHYTLSLQKFVGRNFYSLLDYFSPANLPLLFQLKALVKHSSNIARYFKDERLQAAFTFQNMYLGLSPYDAPATYSLLQYTELGEGVWFPRGGLYQTIVSLEEIARSLGVRFYYNTPVSQIHVDGNRADGITLKSGERLKADIVIANADLPYVYQELMPAETSLQSLKKKKYTSSALMFFWGFKGDRSPDLLHHNVFLADDHYKSSFDSIFKDLTLPAIPSFYLNVPSRTAPDFAPPDGDGIMALVPVGHVHEDNPQDWRLLEERAKSIVFQRLAEMGLTNLEERTVFEAKWGPNYYLKTLNLAKGAAFGLSHNFMQVGYLRPHNRHGRYANLYFVGASTHPGTGLPIVLLSAKLVAQRIAKEMPIAERSMTSVVKPAVENA
jgi:phytoene desaturase